MPRFVKVTRNDTDGSYIEPPDKVLACVDGELVQGIEYWEVGDAITLTVIEMTQEEYDKLPEFTGW
jgi:hypothetical protein